jgi:hypothetical protein
VNTFAQLTPQKHENQIICEKKQLSNLIHIAQQVQVCQPKQTLPFRLQYELANA